MGYDPFQKLMKNAPNSQKQQTAWSLLFVKGGHSLFKVSWSAMQESKHRPVKLIQDRMGVGVRPGFGKVVDTFF